MPCGLRQQSEEVKKIQVLLGRYHWTALKMMQDAAILFNKALVDSRDVPGRSMLERIWKRSTRMRRRCHF